MMRNKILAVAASLVLVWAALLVQAAAPKKPTQSTPPTSRQQAYKAMDNGNYKDAYDYLYNSATDPNCDARKVCEDLSRALQCLNSLGRQDEADDFREKVIAAHSNNWRLLEAAAVSCLTEQHQGYMVAGKFHRGWPRGQAKYANAAQRDRVRGLQLMEQAMEKIKDEPGRGEVGDFYFNFACILSDSQAWQLQYLTDLTKLPDYDEGYYYGQPSGRGSPVNPDGTPVYHYTPKSWKEAATDGQRWRWALLQSMEASPAHVAKCRFTFAQFLLNQFGAQTMAEYGWWFGRVRSDDDDTKKNESGTYELHTLKDDETIAKLANGIKRFTLPDEFNYIRILQDLAKGNDYAEQSLDALAELYKNRRQHPRAAEYLQEGIRRFGNGPSNERLGNLNQIIKNWGMFEPVMTQPAGAVGATVDFRFRNGTKVSFEAFEIDVPKLLADLKDYLKSGPKELEWERIDLNNIGYRLVEKKQKQYLKKQVASWDMDLKPRPNHWDKRITVATPLQKAGAYLLTAKMEGGNVSRIVVWVADTAIVRKPMDMQSYYFVADAVSSQPVAKANLEFFGYNQRWVEDKAHRNGKYVISTRDFAEFTDNDGQLFLKADKQPQEFSWVAIATTPEGRLAFMGFSGVWFGNYHDAEYNQAKYYFITDRPVYRPQQPVKFKIWATQAQYDREGDSPFAGQKFLVRVNNPRGQKIFEQTCTADQFGGFDGEIPATALPKDATLGMYQVQLSDRHIHVGGFRLEEYKKPEFEVKVDAPAEPVMLGEKVAAKITAKYYFGAPVTEGRIKYKVTRTSYSANWYPMGCWDWFYGAGYWWFAPDYAWYPGWREWGCARPAPWWHWNWHPRTPPEIVSEGEVPLGKDGTFALDIDTTLAKVIHADTDHKYEVSAEVTDQSRRTITGTGTVLVARKPFKVYAWVHRGHYRVGDVVMAQFNAHTLDNKPVKGAGELRLLKISYEKDKDSGNLKPVETEVQKWALDTNEDGLAQQQIKASQPGQYRVSYTVTDSKKHVMEGGYVFVVTGEGFDGGDFRFNDIELVLDKREYKPGEKVSLMVNTNLADATVLLFVRPANGFYLPPRVLRLKGKSSLQEIEVIKRDMPNFFVEALTVSGGKLFSEMKEIVVPPEKRVLDVQVMAFPADADAAKADANSSEPPTFKPGQKARLRIKLTDPTGEPFSGSAVIAMYDKALEYISGGSNVPEIKEFFWKWRRHHNMSSETSLSKSGWNILRSGEIGMGFLGVFGASEADELQDTSTTSIKSQRAEKALSRNKSGGFGGGFTAMDAMDAKPAACPAPMAVAAGGVMLKAAAKEEGRGAGNASAIAGGMDAGGGAAMVQPAIRTKLADTALWMAAVSTGKDGYAEVDVAMPENLTTWKTRVWAMGPGSRCGEATRDVITSKNVIIRLQAPRFFVQKDEVVISANVHNYLKTKKSITVELELGGDCLELIQEGDKLSPKPGHAVRLNNGSYLNVPLEVEPGGEKRVDWRVKVVNPGQAVVRVKALTTEESDATEQTFPVYIHGMLKTESFCGVIRPDKDSCGFSIKVPAERKPEQTRLEIRYSPTLAGAMVDALPYLVDYPYGCTEQTVNRFLPTVITQKVLQRMGLDLKAIKDKRVNLNAQEIGDDVQRAKDWGYRGGYMSRDTARFKDPVFDDELFLDMVKAGVERLGNMQCSDGGWGWFSGHGEYSSPHTTAVVVHGLQIAQQNDVAIVPGVLNRGVAWLKQYQAEQVRRLQLPEKDRYHKAHADDLDAFVYMVLVDAKVDNKDMREFLYRDRNGLAVYSKAMAAIAAHKVGDVEKRDMLLQNCEQFLVQDNENQTAFLKLPENNWWWCWYGSENEAQAYYLKLLCLVDPKGEKASRLVKYLLNNRRNSTYWNSTRDTAAVIEALGDFIKASGEDKPDMTVEIVIDGKTVKEVKINKDNLFGFDNKVVLAGKQIETGEHKVELRRKGSGPLYVNAYLTNFTLEDHVTRAGLEIKVERRFYKLVKVDKTIKAEGSRGQAVDQKVEKYERQELKDLSTLKSGEMAEIELEIDSKNDYEYIVFEDMKAAGFEPLEVRSGYNGNDMGAYVEFRDERVSFFVRQLTRGKHSISYRVRAEIPGKFSALPAKASAMYAPELKGNSDEIKLNIED